MAAGLGGYILTLANQSGAIAPTPVAGSVRLGGGRALALVPPPAAPAAGPRLNGGHPVDVSVSRGVSRGVSPAGMGGALLYLYALRRPPLPAPLQRSAALPADVPPVGGAAAIIDATASGVGQQILTGAAAGSIDLTATGAGAQAITGSGSATSSEIAAAGAGAELAQATAAAATSLAASGSGSETLSGSGAPQLATTATGSGAEVLGGSGAAATALSASGSAVEVLSGTAIGATALAAGATGRGVLSGSGAGATAAAVDTVAVGVGAETAVGAGSASIALTGSGNALVVAAPDVPGILTVAAYSAKVSLSAVMPWAVELTTSPLFAVALTN